MLSLIAKVPEKAGISRAAKYHCAWPAIAASHSRERQLGEKIEHVA
jgi:hypothetical protein